MTADAIGFDVFMERALYGADGFYSGGLGPGRREGDFLTSVEIGGLFGAVVANALDSWWDGFGQPSEFPVVESAAGRGALAAAVLAAKPRCLDALRYIAVERAAPARALAEQVSGIEVQPALPFPDTLGDVGVVIANELLDNLSFKIVERAYDGWRELLVVEVEGQASFAMGERVHRFDHVDAEVGARIPWHTHAIQWVSVARSLFNRSHVALIDYGTPTTKELAERPWRGWLRTFRDHGHGKDPLRDPGSQDITCDIAFDQLVPHTLTTQADWLRGHGIDALVDVAREKWHERAAIGDLESLKARSRVNEADLLLDPHGPGGFLVAEWSTV